MTENTLFSICALSPQEQLGFCSCQMATDRQSSVYIVSLSGKRPFPTAVTRAGNKNITGLLTLGAYLWNTNI